MEVPAYKSKTPMNAAMNREIFEVPSCEEDLVI